jgi:hypothetical protein
MATGFVCVPTKEPPSTVSVQMPSLVVEPGGPPVAGPVRLQVCIFQDSANGPGADRVENAVGGCLPGQILAGPVSDAQPPGDRLEAGQLDDLGTLQGESYWSAGSRGHGGTAPTYSNAKNWLIGVSHGSDSCPAGG